MTTYNSIDDFYHIWFMSLRKIFVGKPYLLDCFGNIHMIHRIVLLSYYFYFLALSRSCPAHCFSLSRSWKRALAKWFDLSCQNFLILSCWNLTHTDQATSPEKINYNFKINNFFWLETFQIPIALAWIEKRQRKLDNYSIREVFQSHRTSNGLIKCSTSWSLLF